MMVLNMAKLESIGQGKDVFSIADIKTQYFNYRWLNRIISCLDIDAKLIKMHPKYQSLLNYGNIAA